MMKLTHILAVATLASGIFVSQGVEAKGHHDGKHHKGKQSFFMGKHVAKKLDLTTAQREEIKALISAQKQTRKSNKGERKATKQALMAQVHSESFDEVKVRQMLQAQQAKQLENKLESLKVQNKIWNVLTPEQQQKWQELKQRRAERKSKKRD